jgi:hypothetical protein
LFTFDEKNATLFLSAKIRLDGEINCLRWKEQKKSKNKKDIDCDDESTAEEKSALLAAACDNGMVYLLKHHFQ